MTNTAPVPAPVISREIAPGIEVNTAMTPEQRFMVVAKSQGLTVTRSTPEPQFHTPATVQTIANQERDVKSAAAKAAPPAKVTEQPDPNALAIFDAEMRAKGIQMPTAAEESAYRADAVQWLEDYCNRQSGSWQQANEPKMQQWAARIRAGEVSVGLNKETGAVEIHSRNTPEAFDTAVNRAAKGSDASGVAEHTAISGALLHGYTLPPGRYVVAEAVAGLRQARALGLTQAQVDAYIKSFS